MNLCHLTSQPNVLHSIDQFLLKRMPANAHRQLFTSPLHHFISIHQNQVN
ncbi:hypothetical protein CROQUDRAFT_92842 [Cronartium quercuum f. sp. fusiforme G11]|uniref:Uncharacterized protein n=1 Tax=Cronartium quercuum f. sp. fusiforme G11 TaxID=708437 RepID=A0A9P6TC74_9BASI|nr:hypothetical protein CROQUDRAFT_92842 [Cronartium quercuum f. sp. fusiforme G11]